MYYITILFHLFVLSISKILMLSLETGAGKVATEHLYYCMCFVFIVLFLCVLNLGQQLNVAIAL